MIKIGRAIQISLFAILMLPSMALAAESLPPIFQGATVSENLSAKIPPHFQFSDASGAPWSTAILSDNTVPTVLVFAYFRCPMLCQRVVADLNDALSKSTIPPARYRVVIVSIDPTDSPKTATQFLKFHAIPTQNWTALTGPDTAIKPFASWAGFHYTYDAETDQYAHPAVVTVLSPEGKIVRYIYGIGYRPLDIRLAITEASQGKVRPTLDHLLLMCFTYSDKNGRYTLSAIRVMRIGGAIAVVGLAAFLIWLFRRDYVQHHPKSNSESDTPT